MNRTGSLSLRTPQGYRYHWFIRNLAPLVIDNFYVITRRPFQFDLIAATDGVRIGGRYQMSFGNLKFVLRQEVVANYENSLGLFGIALLRLKETDCLVVDVLTGVTIRL